MKTALNIIKTLLVGLVVWAVAITAIYYIGIFCQWLGKILLYLDAFTQLNRYKKKYPIVQINTKYG